jgi:hypothetical protein
MLLTGAMCVIGSGSSAQVLIAILLVLFFMLLVFKTAPFIDEVDDMLSFLTSLQMMLTLLGGFALLTDNKNEYDRDTFGTALVAINFVAVIFLLISCIALIPAVRSRLNKCGGGGKENGKGDGGQREGKEQASMTKVAPVSEIELNVVVGVNKNKGGQQTPAEVQEEYNRELKNWR